MQIEPIRNDLRKYLLTHGLQRKFEKQIKLFSENPRHPSLHTERLEPKHLGIYSFRIDKKYRAIFVVLGNRVGIIDINPHYK